MLEKLKFLPVSCHLWPCICRVVHELSEHILGSRIVCGSNSGLAVDEWPCASYLSHLRVILSTAEEDSAGVHLMSLLQGLSYSLVAPLLKNLPAMQETWVQSLGQEDPLEEKVATHSNILAWRIPWTERSNGLQSMGSQWVGHNLATKPLPPHSSNHHAWHIASSRWMFALIFLMSINCVSS